MGRASRAAIAWLIVAGLGLVAATAQAQRFDAGAFEAPTLAPLARPAIESVDAPWVLERVRRHELYVVAHPDDDLLFMSPTIPRRLRDPGAEVHVVYLTSGSADPEYAHERETGIRAAYAVATGVPDTWTFTEESFAGRPVQVGHLDGHPTLHLYLMRLHGHLDRLWSGATSTHAIVDAPGVHHTHASLVDALEEIVDRIRPDHVGLLDPTGGATLEDTGAGAHGYDHPDHVAAARFAMSARQRYLAPHRFAIHRGYNTVHAPLPANLSDEAYAAKEWVFRNYAVHDKNFEGCHLGTPTACVLHDSYPAHVGREYSESALQGLSGPLRGTGARCLEGPGTPALESCLPAATTQQWTVTRNQAIRQGAACLDVPPPFVNGRPVGLAACDDSARQRFTLLSDGRILGPASRCLEVVPGVETLRLQDCDAVDRQRFVLEQGRPRFRTPGSDFSDAHLGADPTKARSFSLGDLDGDGDADACVRRADGVWCARNHHGFFASYTRWSADFGDDQGWARDYYGPTLQLGDINGDGRADVCGRGRRGVHCAHSTGSGFATTSMRTAHGDFGNSQGYAHASRATSVGLVDVDGDGFVDVCGRDRYGIRCAVNNGNGFFPSDRAWLVGDFGDAEGWNDPVYGSTLTYGDIDGDGFGDVCGRGRRAVYCARSDGTQLVDVSHWGYDADFSDAQGWDDHVAYYGSIRLADVDGDGRDDLCGRGRAGLWCAISQGTTGFDGMFRIQPYDFRDDQGWRQERFGPTVEWADLDRDGRADVCGRGRHGLLCATSP